MERMTLFSEFMNVLPPLAFLILAALCDLAKSFEKRCINSSWDQAPVLSIAARIVLRVTAY
jgi:hypothetical protein